MMNSERHIMGLFSTEDQVISAVRDLKETEYKFERVNIPFPSHKILDALDLKNKFLYIKMARFKQLV